MFAALAQYPAWWGFLGALMYAAPKLSACLFENHDATDKRSHSVVSCIWEFVTTMVVGVIAAEVFTDLIIAKFGLEEDFWFRATGSLIGLLANPLSPEIQKGFKGRLVGMIKGSSK